jgi:hypothetical protein
MWLWPVYVTNQNHSFNESFKASKKATKGNRWLVLGIILVNIGLIFIVDEMSVALSGSVPVVGVWIELLLLSFLLIFHMATTARTFEYLKR